MRNKASSINIDNSDLVKYPNGRIKDNTGAGDGTPVNEFIYGDLHEFKDKLMRLAGLTHNGLPDNQVNGYQSIDSLRDFGSKHDVVQSITTASGVLNVSVKLSTMQLNENLICKSSIDFTSETQIKGSDLTTFSVTVIGNFKTDEYVRLIKTGSGVVLIRLVDSVNLDLAIGEFLYLKKASQAQENAGAVDTVSTTPLVNKVTFTRRVNGVDSGTYLATPSQNGLLSMADKTIIDNFSSGLKNVGFVSGVNVNSGSGSYPVGGDISAATIQASAGGRQEILITMANAMTNTNYEVQVSIQSQAAFSNDVEIQPIVFKPISTTQFEVALRESSGASQNLKLHFRVFQLT